MNNGISARIVEKTIQQNGIKIVYPQVTGLPDQEVQEQINRAIEQTVYTLMAEQRVWPDSAGLKIEEMIGTYEIEVNKNGILSIRFENYMYPEHAAHGTTMVKSITVDLNTGKVYTLRDLFRPGTDYIIVLNKLISQQFKEQDIPMINEFNGITIQQEFYLTPTDLVIYFQAYEYTPGSVGIPEFKIPYRTIINYINQEGPGAWLLTY
ncbi:anti-SigV factor [Desulfocucumis palustris]|uniref:Anti-SigV factor n=1 Tax=Desulfocucumis palustris TaxID=1898651 RepID=A0A2L2X9J6_9FIRM|nr:DUF3298 and DUF4163 domain-containing protein [Desulfocucumis palustris]GBF32712.1 anti-SigV factor [Desulfocucumis palustris]